MHDRPAEETWAHPWVEADGDGVSFGAWLRQQRELRGISIHEIARFSKISLRYLEALEASRFSVLPAPVFAKGFLRQYASYVGLDPDEVVNYYIVAQQGEISDEDLDPVGGSRLHSSTHWAYGLFLTVGIVFLFALVALLSFLAERDGPSEGEAPPLAVPVFSPPPAAPATARPVTVAPLVVTLDFLRNGWVEASVDGESRVSETVAQGESLQLSAQEQIVLSLGNPAGVRVQVNGEDYLLPLEQQRPEEELTVTFEAPASASGVDPLASAQEGPSDE